MNGFACANRRGPAALQADTKLEEVGRLSSRAGEVARTLWLRVNWQSVGVAASASILAISAVVLYYRLRDLDWRMVGQALYLQSARDIAAAALFTACGYVTLTFYDWFALRTIGARQVPFRTAALAGVTSYAIGHGVGAMVVASAVVRYRLYSRWGLGVIDIAKVCFIAGLTFWLGNVTVLAVSMVFMPGAAQAVDHLPIRLNQVIGLAALFVLAGYLAWVWQRPRALGRDGSAVPLPSGAMTLLQIGIGLTDLTCCSLVMYLLMPAVPGIDFFPLAVVVVFGTLLGFASHAPGAIGALDAVMLIALPTFDRASLVATLLLYRLLYFVTPFGLALAGLGIREARMHLRSR